jgi:hypothetical protein
MPRTKRHSPLHGPPIEATDRGERSRQALARARQITGVVNSETPYGWRRTVGVGAGGAVRRKVPAGDLRAGRSRRDVPTGLRAGLADPGSTRQELVEVAESVVFPEATPSHPHHRHGCTTRAGAWRHPWLSGWRCCACLPPTTKQHIVDVRP